MEIGLLLVVTSCSVDGVSGSTGQKIGRYVFRAHAPGIEIAETQSVLGRWFHAIFGQAPEPKIRIGAQRSGPNDFEASAIGELVVRRRRLVGPAAKPTAMKRPWEVRLLDARGEALSPFFYFRDEATAATFAEELRSRLAALRGDSEPGSVEP